MPAKIGISYPSFLAIDFETANQYRNSACSVGLVLVKNKRIIEKADFLIKPPEKYFHWRNISIHGITWNDVKDQPTFKQLWKDFKPFFEEADFMVAHNAPFDKSVLYSCCQTYHIKQPSHSFCCTYKLAKQLWNFKHARLSDVCKRFNIPLNHHQALSDSEACAKISLKAIKEKKYVYEFTQN